MKKLLLPLVILGSIYANAVFADQVSSCDGVETFYQTHQFECVDKLLKSLDEMDNPELDPNRIQNQIGFLAGIVITYPDKIDSILSKKVSQNARSAVIGALYRAGMSEKAVRYAHSSNMFPLFDSYQKSSIPLLAKTYSHYNPGDNDLLIGAFMATGDKIYIENIIHQYKDADDKMVRNALRIAAMQGKFGPELLSKTRKEIYTREHRENPLKALAIRENWQKYPKESMQTLTMASAFWALSSLAGKHKPIGEVFTDFFSSDSRLNKLANEETNNFTNYIMLSVILPAMDNKQNNSDEALKQEVEQFLTSYENFEVVKAPNLKPQNKKQ